MFSNNLNGAYEYESERRNDERRTAAENHLAHELGGRREFSLSSPMVIIGALTLRCCFLPCVLEIQTGDVHKNKKILSAVLLVDVLAGLFAFTPSTKPAVVKYLSVFSG